MKFVERVHDVSKLGVGDEAERYCDNCQEIHVFLVFIAIPGGRKVGRADCPKALFGMYTQLMNVDHVPES